MSNSSHATPQAPPGFFSALVVGSGFGASVLALRLAEAYADTPRRVCVLERGRRYEASDFPRFKLPDYLTDNPQLRSSRRVPDGSRHLWGIDQGLFDVRTLGRLQVVQGAGLGGGSLIYAGVHLRPPHETFAKWPEPYCDPQAMDRAFAKVHAEIDPQPLPDALADELPKARLMRDAAAKLGLAKATMRPPLTIRFATKPGEPNTCNGCGNCTLGCQEGAKLTLDRNYLKRAMEQGVHVQTLCEVKRLARCDGSDQCFYHGREERCSAPPGEAGPSIGEHYRVEYFDHLEHVARHVCAQHVFLGAGAVGTTELLLRSRSGLQREAAPSGLDKLGERFYANGDSLSVVFDTRESASPSYGPTITTSVAYGDPSDPSSWFLLQDGGISRDLAGVLGLFRSPLWLGRNRWTRAEGRGRGLREPARSAGDQLIMDLQVGVSDWLSPHKPAATRGDGELSALSRAWLNFMPLVLRDPLASALRLSDDLRAELRKLDRRVLEKLGPETFFLSRLVDQEQLLELIAGVTAELYPPLRRLLRKDAGMAALYDVLRALLLAHEPTQHALVLLAMGPDQRGHLSLREGKLRVDWEEDANLELYTRQEQLMRDFAVELGGELRTNPSWTLGRRPVSVHMQGGCSMPDVDTAEGVTDADGQVRGFPGLYVVDAAAFPRSVGVNPSASIAAVAELKAEQFIARVLKQTLQPSGRLVQVVPIAPARSYALRSQPLCLTWSERLSGQWSEDPYAQPPRRHTDAAQYLAEEQAPPHATQRHLALELDVVVDEPERLLRALSQRLGAAQLRQAHDGALAGRIRGRLFDADRSRACEGSLYLHFDPSPSELERELSQLASELGTSPARVRELFHKYAHLPTLGATHRLIGLEYRLHAGELMLRGRKFFHDDPGHDVWPDLTTLYVFGECRDVRRSGVVRVSLSDFLTKQLPSYDCFVAGEAARDPWLEEQVRGGDARRYAPDEAVRSWLLLRFGAAFFTSIKDVYERWY